MLTRQADPPELVELLRSGGITTTLMAPVVIQFLLAVPGVDRTRYPMLRNISYGASPISEAVPRRAMEVFGCELVQVYGLTGNMGTGTYLDAADHDPARGLLRACGKPYPGGEVRVVGPDDQPLAAGRVGEIQFRAPWNMAGYWNRPAATEARLAGGWLRTGDAGYFDEDGYLYVHDRIKDMVVTGGENVYPAEVENARFAHPAVADAAVIGVPDDTWREAVKAVVVLAEGHENESVADEIREFLQARIAGYKVPKTVDILSSLPRNASGKTLKQELRAPCWPDGHRTVNQVAGSGHSEVQSGEAGRLDP